MFKHIKDHGENRPKDKKKYRNGGAKEKLCYFKVLCMFLKKECIIVFLFPITKPLGLNEFLSTSIRI